tara:strand:+ start:565 stop:969 length:405 start_codon:yes stop_codon:yes gene_type:complete
MQYKILLVLILMVYVFSGYIYDSTNNTTNERPMNFQKEIYVDESEIRVFKRQSVKDISVIEKKVKSWIIEINYNDSNLENIKNKLIENGYKLNNNKVKMIITIGPFTAISHAKEESRKINKILGIDNKVSSFIF